MEKIIITGESVFCDGQFKTDTAIVIHGELIAEIIHADNVQNYPGAVIHDYPGAWIAPGFIDIHVNGGGGVLFNDALDEAAIADVIAAHRRYGTTQLMATLISDTLDNTYDAMNRVDQIMKTGLNGLLGLHLEGPFLNPAYKGTHNPAFLLEPDNDAIQKLCKRQKGRLMLTLAPELFTAEQLLALSNAGVIMSAGHSAATYDEAATSRKSGVGGVTHTFNAMRPIKGREPGLAGFALRGDDFYASVILDGIHCHHAVLELLFESKPWDKIIAVTDAMPLVGSDDTHFYLNGKRIELKNGALYDERGILSGAHIGMSQSIQFLMDQFDYPLRSIIPFFSENPAKYLKLDHRTGFLKCGYQANVTIMDTTYAVLNTYINGVPLALPTT